MEETNIPKSFYFIHKWYVVEGVEHKEALLEYLHYNLSTIRGGEKRRWFAIDEEELLYQVGVVLEYVEQDTQTAQEISNKIKSWVIEKYVLDEEQPTTPIVSNTGSYQPKKAFGSYMKQQYQKLFYDKEVREKIGVEPEREEEITKSIEVPDDITCETLYIDNSYYVEPRDFITLLEEEGYNREEITNHLDKFFGIWLVEFPVSLWNKIEKLK